jgi:hypothetical protein
MLVARLCAEMLSQRVIRMFPPDSSFRPLPAPNNQANARREALSTPMPPAEVGGCHFRLKRTKPPNQDIVMLRAL